MSATLDQTFRPPRWAVSAWVDENSLFIAIPMKGKPPFIDRKPLSREALGEALAQMRDFHRVQAGPPIYTPPARPTVALRRPGPLSSDARVALAQGILKRLMITPKG